ncbi:YegS/Rv2252/BmrU family lipid kinase, partial [bacterium]
IAAGGDGTINEVVQGLAGSQTVLSILPVGTTNVMARDLKIPINFQDALQVIDNGEERTIDLGILNDRYFVLMAGIGFDAKLVNDVDSNFKKMTGMVAFAATSPISMLGQRISKMSVTLWDKNGKKKKIKRSSYQALVSNSATYAIDLTVSLGAKPDDGLLDLDIFKTGKLHKFAWQLINIAFLTKKSKKEEVEGFQFQKAMIKADPPMPIQVDGDSYGYTPALIEVKANYLKILSPKA